MRVFGRNDVFLIGGFAMALWVVTSRQLGTLLDRAREIDHSRGLQLVPGLFILIVVFLVHQFRKREEMRVKASQATSRAADMDRLVQFGKALAQSLDGDSIRAATTKHLPLIACNRNVWAVMQSGSEWIALTPVEPPARAAIEHATARAIGGADVPADAAGDDVYCIPLVAGGARIGAIGVSPYPPLTETDRSALAAAAALLGPSAKNAELFNEAHENSVRDVLTGCFNRRHAMEVMDAEVRRARRSRNTFSALMFDIDHFKAINDRHGHLCGDAVLAQVGHRMKAVLRGSDIKCRYGGEEFLVLLPDTPLDPGACRVAEMLRRDLEEHPVHWNGEPIVITASFGITESEPGDNDPQAVLARADAALYQAKQDGRNRIRVAELSAAQHA